MAHTLPIDLKTHHCVPCEGGTKPLKPEEFEVYHQQVANWKVIEEKVLEREFEFKNFNEAIEFINHTAKIAEAESHHPDLLLHNYKKVKVALTTHAIRGLSVNDFVVAVKIDELL